MDATVAALTAALALAGVHALAGLVRSPAAIPRSRWLSLAGGISVAYVVVHLLPELSQAQKAVDEGASGVLPFLEDHAYLLALVGLALFYGVERASSISRAGRRAASGEDHTGQAAFRLSLGSFALYNAIIGYLLLHRDESNGGGLVLFSVAMGVHFVVNDFGLRDHHKQRYDELGRWLLAAAILAGWAVGALTEISEAAIGVLLAFIAGGVILNVIKEELPAERESRFGPFVAGAAAYAGLLQLV